MTPDELGPLLAGGLVGFLAGWAWGSLRFRFSAAYRALRRKR